MKSEAVLTVDNVLSLIPTGRENAVSMKYLANVFGVRERDIRRSILDARLSGHVVCGTSYGYYYPADRFELKEYIHAAYSRAVTAYQSTRTARALLKDAETKATEQKEETT